MLKRSSIIRTVGVTTAVTLLMTGAFAGSALAAYDDMDAVSLSRKMVGVDYSKGSESPSAGFDASGLIFYVYDKLDYSMPRTLAAQFNMDKPFIKSMKSAKAGDVLFFGSGKSPAYSGVYIGNDKMISASQSRDEVVVRTITSSDDKQFLGARRVLNEKDQMRVGLVLTARQYLGTPYDFGAKYGQTKTFDCSSFMKWIFNKYDITLPRVSRNQAKEGKFVSKKNLETGDLVFFTTIDSGSKIGHVGMYVGDGMMIHTYGEGGVKYSTIESGWWDKHYVTARRVIN
jgi:cell wall-associated NlpC family hydrolase